MISSYHFTYKKFNFPCGETQVKIEKVHDYPVEEVGIWGRKDVSITWDYEHDAEIIELLLIADAVRRLGLELHILFLHYVPYSRQDRVVNRGEALSIKVFCDLINNLNFKYVVINDPHSDVTPALLNKCDIVTQEFIFEPLFNGEKNFILVCPDAGASKKIYKLAKTVKPRHIMEFFKVRNPETGEIEAIDYAPGVMGFDINTKFFIVDDICDGGRTFIEIAKVLKDDLEIPSSRITLMVTHGFFTKGLEVFDGLIDHIYTRKGKVK